MSDDKEQTEDEKKLAWIHEQLGADSDWSIEEVGKCERCGDYCFAFELQSGRYGGMSVCQLCIDD